MKTVKDLFVAMENNDSSLAAKVFTEDAMLFTVMGEESEEILRKTPATNLIAAFGTPKDDLWQEPIWDEEVRIEDNLASVWVKYAFYLNGKLSHCGVDAFHLVRIKNQWKIFHLADTRKTDCTIPGDIIKQFQK